MNFQQYEVIGACTIVGLILVLAIYQLTRPPIQDEKGEYADPQLDAGDSADDDEYKNQQGYSPPSIIGPKCRCGGTPGVGLKNPEDPLSVYRASCESCGARSYGSNRDNALKNFKHQHG